MCMCVSRHGRRGCLSRCTVEFSLVLLAQLAPFFCFVLPSRVAHDRAESGVGPSFAARSCGMDGFRGRSYATMRFACLNVRPLSSLSLYFSHLCRVVGLGLGPSLVVQVSLGCV
ncbi:unnamed protein product [Ectocarpus sp. 12 AP-2014]